MAVSVVIPTCNGAAFLRDAFESVFAQTVRPSEIVVVDDASTDGTPALVRQLAAQAPVPVRLLVESHNHGGPAEPLNRGIAAAAGDLIAVLDQDDVFLPEKIEVQSRLLQRHADVAAAVGICGSFPGTNRTFVPAELLDEITRRAQAAPAAADSPNVQFLAGPDALHILFAHGNFAMGFPGFMFRKADWETCGGLDAGLKIAADLDFFCRLCTRGRVAFVPQVHYRRREHEGNLCRDRVAVNWELQEVCLRYRRHFRNVCCTCGFGRTMRDQVFRGAWDARDRRDYRRAARLLFHGFCHWPCDWRMSVGLMKLPLHWLRSHWKTRALGSPAPAAPVEFR